VDFADHLADEFQRRPHTAVRPADLAVSLDAVGRRLLGRGDRVGIERVWRGLNQLAEQTRDPTAIAVAASARATLAFIDGRLDEAASIGQSAVTLATAAGVGQTLLTVTGRTSSSLARILYYVGGATELRLTEYTRFHGARRPERAERALIESWLGQYEEALRLSAGFGNIGDSNDRSAVWILAYLLEVSIRCGDAVTAEALVGRLAPLANRLQTWYSIVSFGRLLGEATAMLGQPKEAEAFYLQGLEVCRKVRFRPEIALICLDLAELRLEHFDAERAEALSDLNFAIDDFDAMHMTPSLERARWLARTVQSEATPSVPSEVDVLTPREREVAALLARGISNRGIAEALVISETTAEVHVKHILGKLGFQSRSQAAVWAAEHGLARAADPRV
jgi:DNA-binding CsgD family transcriptional regulator